MRADFPTWQEKFVGVGGIVRRGVRSLVGGLGGLGEFRVQSLFELTNSKPTKLALKAVPSEQRTYAAMEHHMHTIRLQRT